MKPSKECRAWHEEIGSRKVNRMSKEEVTSLVTAYKADLSGKDSAEPQRSAEEPTDSADPPSTTPIQFDGGSDTPAAEGSGTGAGGVPMAVLTDAAAGLEVEGKEKIGAGQTPHYVISPRLDA